MKAFARVWTWMGQSFLPLAFGWAVYVRGGQDGPHLEEGVLISRGYWGLLVTMAVGAALIFVAALYVREARRARANTYVPPNTMFEEAERNAIISWTTVAVFSASVLAAFILFLNRYLDSKIHGWDAASPLAGGFWSGRIKAHELGCGHSPCYALAQRLYSGNPVSGVNEYVLYFTDGALVLLAVLFCIATAFLIYALSQSTPPPPRYGR